MNNGKICVSVFAETADEMIGKIMRAYELADVIEVRFDHLESDQIQPLVARLSFEKPLIATFRSTERDVRAGFWKRFGKTCPIVDLEEDVFEFVDTPSRKIVSFHDLARVPDDLGNIYKTLSKRSEIVKIAVKADDIAEAIDIWRLIANANGDATSIIPIAMGEAGKWTRILGLAHGAYMTYASLDEGEETADGQITAKDLIEVYRVKELDKNTAVYGVIGDPVSSSLSPYLHNAAFAAEGVNAVFLPLQVKNLDEFVRRMVAPATREVELNFAGFSVTMPHKQTVIKHLNEIDAVAEKIGAVNTVKIVDDKLIGYNTDADGFITPLKTKFGDLKNVSVAVIGAGGAARACVYALVQAGAEVRVFARDPKKASLFSDEFNVKVEQLTTDHQPLTADIVVNATPLGMTGVLENECPLSAEQLKGVRFVYDLVTRADDTPLVSAAKNLGIPAIGGLEMLVAQGVKQFEIWTGCEAPTDLMRLKVLERLTA